MEEIFNEIATKNMLHWNEASFKHDYRTLYKTIIESMEAAVNKNNKTQ